MRGKRTVINTVTSLTEEIVSIICGFILPRLILAFYGSELNGLVTSISQFLTGAMLLRAGIGGATRAALYRPLAEKNKQEVDSIVKATDIFMKKVSVLLGAAIVCLAVLYPFLVENEKGWLFTCTLFLIIGMSTFAESFFGVTYLIVLQADQQLWVSSIIRIVCNLVNTVLAVILMHQGFSIHIVKLGSAVVYVLYPILLNIYVVKHYGINKNVQPNNKAIEQRWDAFWQQVAVFVVNHSGVLIVTVCMNLLEVSVYSIYNLIATGLKRVVTAFSSALEAAFGNMIAKQEFAALKQNVEIAELIMYDISTVIYVTAAIMILDFVQIYTQGIQDVNYIRPVLAYLMLGTQFFNGIRLPYQMVVQAAGHYKQTKKAAIAEPIISMVVSVLLVGKYGLTGVAIGLLFATVFRTVYYSCYMSCHIVKRSVWNTIFRIGVSGLECMSIFLLVNVLQVKQVFTVRMWIGKGIVIFLMSFFMVGIGSALFYRGEMEILAKKMKMVINADKIQTRKG